MDSVLRDLVESLLAVLESLTGSRPKARRAAASMTDDRGGMLWWKQPLSVAGGEVWVGADPTALRALASLAPAAGEDGVESSFGELMASSWEGIESVSGSSTREQPPSTSRMEELTIEFPGASPLALVIAARSTGKPGRAASMMTDSPTMDLLLDMELPLTVRFGSTRMSLQEIVRLSTGSVVDFERPLEEPVDLLVNGRVVARGEMVVVKGNYAVRISEIASRPERLNTAPWLTPEQTSRFATGGSL